MAWKCDKCECMNPNTSGNCIHCGAYAGGGYIAVGEETATGEKKSLLDKFGVRFCVLMTIISIVIFTIFLVVFA